MKHVHSPTLRDKSGTVYRDAVSFVSASVVILFVNLFKLSEMMFFKTTWRHHISHISS